MKRIGTGARMVAAPSLAPSLAASLVASLALMAGAPVLAAPPGSKAELARGAALLTANCGRCHAVGKSGDSAHHLAPPFRILGQRYTIESLEEALGEGLISGHPDMPEFKFPPADVGAIVDYLKSIQVKK